MWLDMTFSETAESIRRDWDARLKKKDLRKKTFNEYCYNLGTLERVFGEKLLCEISEMHKAGVKSLTVR